MPNKPWQPERPIDQTMAHQWIALQFPELAPLTIEPYGQGWDNAAFLLGGRWIFRFPQRSIAEPLLQTEARLLPWLSERLPLPIPNPRFIGSPTPEFPALFAGYACIPGQTACRAELDREARRREAPALARFLSALHRIDPREAIQAGVDRDTLQRTDVERHTKKARNYLGRLLEEGVWASAARLGLELLEEALDALPPDSTASAASLARLVHGDLYARHLLVNEQGRLCGVIDWGDVHLGDPALDLSIAFGFLPPEAHEEFIDAYGGIEPQAWARARFRAIHHTATLLGYGADIGDSALTSLATQIYGWLEEARYNGR